MKHLALLASLLGVCAAFLGVGASAASAQTSRELEFSWSVPVSDPQVEATDSNGYVYVWSNQNLNLTRYDPNSNPPGQPVPFSALGTNTIDGKGNGDCATVPSSCDQVFGNGFEAGYEPQDGPSAIAVDTSGGPANGYIYVLNNYKLGNNGDAGYTGRVNVFNPSGRYVGDLPVGIAYPGQFQGVCGLEDTAPCQDTGVSVSSNGHVFQSGGSQLDQFAPVDGNPAHDVFVGELRDNAWNSFAATSDFTYAEASGGLWQKYTNAEFLNRETKSVPVDFGPAPGPFGDGAPGAQVSVDSVTGDAYVARGDGDIEQWNSANQQVGQAFGAIGAGHAQTVAVDHSGGPGDGRAYTQGTLDSEFIWDNSVAAFSPPVIVPDISYGPPTVGHTTAQVSGTIGLAGGPVVTECHVEYGYDQSYGSVAPCNQSTPYSGPTNITADLSGLAFEHDSHYRIVVANSNGISYGEDHVVRASAVLGVSTDPATGVDPTHATLNGSLNPDGIATTYHFVYGLTTDYDSSTPVADAGNGTGTAPVPPADLSDLQPGRTYHYALTATNSFGTTLGNDQTFTTSQRPAISGIDAVNVTATTADLRARINPFGSDTTYKFEYGLTPTYGTTLPIPDGDAGAGLGDQPVTVHLADLESGVTYHFRVTATNKWGTSESDDATFGFFPPDCPNAHARQQTGSSYLPDCRAYELVSPGNAGPVQLFPGGITEDAGIHFTGYQTDPIYHYSSQNTGLATNPPRFSFYGGLGALNGTNPPNTFLDMYVASRTDQGWITTHPGLSGNQSAGAARQQCSQDMSICLDHPIPSTTGDFPENAPYVWKVNGDSLGRWPTNVGAIPGGKNFFGDQLASGDFSHYFFSSRNLAFAPGGPSVPPGAAYDNDIGSSTVHLVSLQPDGSPIPQVPSTDGDPAQVIHIPASSTDGSRVLLAATTDPPCDPTDPNNDCPAPISFPARLYMRVNDSVTYDVTHGHLGTFVAMTPNGDRVYFTSAEQVTPDDTDSSVDLFMWNEAADSITRISQGGGAGNSDACNASWTSGCGVSPLTTVRPELDDLIASGSGDVYFYSPESLDPATPGIANQRNLYVYRDGAVRLVTTLAPGTQMERSQISADGQHAAFLTTSSLTGYDNAGFSEMYRYDTADGLLQCVSCPLNGLPPTSDVAASDGGRFMSDDGRVFFSTSDGLVPKDTDGVADVYEFVGGRAQLISSGTADRDETAGGVFYPVHKTGLEGVSRSGVDVYFSTFDSLVSSDQNGSTLKFYDARTGGGFNEPDEAAPCKAADECHGVDSTPPNGLQIGTSSSLGSGDQPAATTRTHRKAHHKRHQRRHSKHGGHAKRQGRSR